MALKRFVRDDLEWMINSTREGRKAWERLVKEQEGYLDRKKAILADQDQTQKQRDAQAETLDKMVLGVEEQIKAHKEKTESHYNDILNDFLGNVSDLYMPNGKALDPDTVALLSSGIPLTDTEVSNLVRRYAQNPTMLRLIGGYIDKHNHHVNDDLRNTLVGATSAGADEIKAFRYIWNICRWCAEGSGMYLLDVTEGMVADARQELTGYTMLCEGGE